MQLQVESVPFAAAQKTAKPCTRIREYAGKEQIRAFEEQRDPLLAKLDTLVFPVAGTGKRPTGF